MEGRLFREIVERAAVRTRLASSTWRERDLAGQAVTLLARPEPSIRAALLNVARPSARPWRTEHKAAALAAWLVLAGPGRARRRRRAAA